MATKKSKATKAKNTPRAPATASPAWESIYATVERIPKGRVCTYGGVAQVAGLPRRARLVGTALRSLPSSRTLPWHRVITSSGRLAFPEGSDAYAKQRTRLAREGIKLVGKRVDLSRYGWPREGKSLDELLWGAE